MPGWVFSSELSEQDIDDVRGLIAMNGLPIEGASGHGPTGDGSEDSHGRMDMSVRAVEADAAFERLAAEHPNATIIRGPAAGGCDESAVRAAEADAAFARMAAAYPNATIIGGPNAPSADGGEEPTGAGDAAARAEADAAFERMAVTYPNATIIGGPDTLSADGGEEPTGAGDTAARAEADSAFERMTAAYPNATIIRGPAAGGAVVAAPPPTSGSWVFSADLSPDRLAEIQGLVAMNGIAPGAAADASTDEETTAAADEAFAAMLASHPGATEVAPGVFSAGD